MYNNLAGDNGRLDQYPFDSHGNTLMIFMALISTLSLGDIPDAQKWFDFTLPRLRQHAVAMVGPGRRLRQRHRLRRVRGRLHGRAVGSDQPGDRREPVRQALDPGLPRLRDEFTPPGAKVHAFGDGSETKPDPRVFRAFAQRMVNAARRLVPVQAAGIEDAVRARSAVPDADAGNTVFIAAVERGLLPEHRLGRDAQRYRRRGTSFYFKSSPYGSFNHSHGDQNGLLLSVAGQPLLVKAGWYDWYGSPQWTDWYHQTKSQNAVTFDGGKGQLVDGYREQLQRNGKITGSRSSRLRLCGRRRDPGLWRPADDGQAPDLVPARPRTRSGARQAVGRGAAHLRVQRPRPGGDDGREPVEREDRGRRPVGLPARPERQCAVRDLDRPGAEKGVTEDHGAFYLKNDGKSVGEFLVLLDVGCKRPTVKVTARGTSRTLTVGSQTVT
jgi:hypothetical protein